MMESVANACIPVAEPNWWAMVSIACGIFVLGAAVGALIGVVIEREAAAVRAEATYELYDPSRPQ